MTEFKLWTHRKRLYFSLFNCKLRLQDYYDSFMLLDYDFMILFGSPLEKLRSSYEIFFRQAEIFFAKSDFHPTVCCFRANQVVFLVTSTDFFPVAARCAWKNFQASAIGIFFASHTGCSSCQGNVQG